MPLISEPGRQRQEDLWIVATLVYKSIFKTATVTQRNTICGLYSVLSIWLHLKLCKIQNLRTYLCVNQGLWSRSAPIKCRSLWSWKTQAFNLAMEQESHRTMLLWLLLLLWARVFLQYHWLYGNLLCRPDYTQRSTCIIHSHSAWIKGMGCHPQQKTLIQRL